MTTRRLNCRELIEFLADYLDAELAPQERAAFEAHLAVCPYCVDYLATYRETIHLGRQALVAEAEILEEVPAQLVDAILAVRRRGESV
jgi:anti-sigma factor RsiW